MPDRGGLTAFQVRVARAFFDLEPSQGFYLAGGAALIAREVVSRRTQDLDLFTTRGVGDVAAAQVALVGLAEREGWTCVVERSVPGFARLALRDGADELLVDLAEDAPPLIQPGATFLGPTLTVEESAGQKTLALYGRAEPRDFVDVRALSDRFGRERLLELAAERDTGFVTDVLAEMIDQLALILDDEIDVAPDQLPELRAFYAEWATELRAVPPAH